MSKVRKSQSLALILIMVLPILIMVGTVCAQTSTKPATPEFTISIENDTIALVIENQPFDPNNSSNSSFYYDVRITGIDGYWKGLYKAEERPTQSNSDTTTLYYPIGKSDVFPSLTTVAGIIIPTYGTVYFQVMALIGYLVKTDSSYGLIGAVSSWSNSKTIDLGSTNVPFPTLYFSPEGSMGTSYKLIMFSPDDKTIYNNSLPLEFILSWTYDLIPLGELRADYAYSIDDKPFTAIAPVTSTTDRSSDSNPSFSYILDISSLSNGYHNIVIKANFYNGNILFLNASSTPFQFTVRTPTPTDTPSPTQTQAPTSPTTNPTAVPSVPEFPATLAITFLVIVALAVAVVSRRKKQ